MRWRSKQSSVKPEPFDRTLWHPWFAWRPMLVGIEWVWLESIERKACWAKFPNTDTWFWDYEYRDTNGGRGYPAGRP